MAGSACDGADRGHPDASPPPLRRREVAVPQVQKLLHEEVRNTGPAVPSTKKRRSVGEAMEGSSPRRCPRLRGAQRRGRLGARHTASRQHRVRLVIYGVVLAVLCLRQPRQRKRPAAGYLNLTCSKPSLQSHYRAGRWWVLHARWRPRSALLTGAAALNSNFRKRDCFLTKHVSTTSCLTLKSSRHTFLL